MEAELPIEELLQGLAGGTLPNERFRHRDHLRLAHHLVLREGYPFALEAVTDTIRRFATGHGLAEKFHLTMTHCWVRLVAAALADEPWSCSFERLVARHPALLDRGMPLRYYSRDRLFADSARAAWMEPDLAALPSCPIHRGGRSRP